MEGIYFLLIWIGSALLHTLYDLKIKPYYALGHLYLGQLYQDAGEK